MLALSPNPPRCHFSLFPVPTGPGEEDCTPCTPEGPAAHWRCVPACREGFYPADSHGLPNKVCKRYRTTRAKPGLIGSAASHNRITLETAHNLMEIKTGMREPGQLGAGPHTSLPCGFQSGGAARSLPEPAKVSWGYGERGSASAPGSLEEVWEELQCLDKYSSFQLNLLRSPRGQVGGVFPTPWPSTGLCAGDTEMPGGNNLLPLSPEL